MCLGLFALLWRILLQQDYADFVKNSVFLLGKCFFYSTVVKISLNKLFYEDFHAVKLKKTHKNVTL